MSEHCGYLPTLSAAWKSTSRLSQHYVPVRTIWRQAYAKHTPKRLTASHIIL